MADYYTRISLVVSLPNATAQQYALNLADQARRASEGDELPAEMPQELRDVLKYWQFETEAESPAGGHGIWLHSEDGGVDAVCAFVQHLLQKFDPLGRVTFQWSNDCSKPRTDAYGGGAAIISAKEIKTMSTGQWLAQNAG